MLKTLVKVIGITTCLSLPCAAYAVGMGGINVSSSLGEPLKAEIELVAVSKAEKGKMTARLASPEAFKSAGIDYPAGLSKLKFQIETHANGEPYLTLTTAQPLNEPFVNVLIELSWSSGKLLREYTFLLDPPEFKAKQPKAAEVKPVTPVIEAPVKQEPATLPPPSPAPEEEKAPAPVQTPATTPTPAVAEPPVAATPLPAAKPAEPAAATKPEQAPATGTIEVNRGDTLSQIALNSKPAGVSLERMLLALYRANTEAFGGNNMNRLKTGKILRIPDQDEIDKITQKEAVAEFRAQVAEWNDYRQKLAAASVAAPEQSVKQEISGKISTAITDKSTATKEPPKEVVKLSKGEIPGDKTVTSGSAKAKQEKTHAQEEEAIAKEKTLKDSSERAALLEKNIKEMQRLAELKSQPPAPAKPGTKAEPPKAEAKPVVTPAPAASQPPATPAVAVPASVPAAVSAPVVAASAAVAASAVKPAKPKPVVVPPPPPSLMDDLMDNPALLAGGAAALLALGGLGIMVARRRKGGKPGKKKTPEIAGAAADIGESEAEAIAETAAPQPEASAYAQQPVAATLATHAQTEDEDPLSEAELFLNFGRDAQAEEILKDALAKNPANNPVRLKLLSIYANRKDTNSFSVIARQIESSGDTDAWAQAAEMGRNIDPGNPMYGGTAETPAAMPAQDLSKSQPIAGLDLDLGFGAPESPVKSSAAVETTGKKELESTFTGLDFDLGGTEPEQPSLDAISAQALSPAEKNTMDFDISGSLNTPTINPEKTSLDDLVFDITASHPDLGATAEEKTVAVTGAPASGEDSGLAFTLDFPTESQPAATAKESADFDLGSINLNLEEPSTAQGAELKDAHWQDVATKLDLARAYQEMGDNAGAREILEEVIAEGDEQQRAAAESIKQQLPA